MQRGGKMILLAVGTALKRRELKITERIKTVTEKHFQYSFEHPFYSIYTIEYYILLISCSTLLFIKNVLLCITVFIQIYN